MSELWPYPGVYNNCVTSVINNRIREYMMDKPGPLMISSDNKVSTTVLPKTLDISLHNTSEPCPRRQSESKPVDATSSVRRIGNSLEALLRQSKKASHAVRKVTVTEDKSQHKRTANLQELCQDYIQFIATNSPTKSNSSSEIRSCEDNGTSVGDMQLTAATDGAEKSLDTERTATSPASPKECTEEAAMTVNGIKSAVTADEAPQSVEDEKAAADENGVDEPSTTTEVTETETSAEKDTADESTEEPKEPGLLNGNAPTSPEIDASKETDADAKSDDAANMDVESTVVAEEEKAIEVKDETEDKLVEESASVSATDATDVSDEADKSDVKKESLPDEESTDLSISLVPRKASVEKVEENDEKKDIFKVERTTTASVDGRPDSAPPHCGKRRLDEPESGCESSTLADGKRIRFDESIFEEDERERLIRQFADKSTETADECARNCDKLQHEIAALADLARAKELEWNSIMRLFKLKEEMLERILFKKRHFDSQNKSEAEQAKFFKHFNAIPSTEISRSNRSETNTPASLSNHLTVMPVGTSSIPTNTSITPVNPGQEYYRPPNNGAISDMSKNRFQRTILPKPTQQHSQSTMAIPQSQPPAPVVMTVSDPSQTTDRASILDVKSLINDYRAKPETSRRGRRYARPTVDSRFVGSNTSLLSMANMALGSGSQVRAAVSSSADMTNYILNQDTPVATTRSEMQMRHPQLDSLMLAVSSTMSTSQPNGSTNPGMFQEALVQFAKMNEKQHQQQQVTSNTTTPMAPSSSKPVNPHLPPPPPYPEVTLHPVLGPQGAAPPAQNSLLHCILTKSSSQQHVNSTTGINSTTASTIQHRPTTFSPTTFSPTLARLLIAPERKNERGTRTAGATSNHRNTKSALSEILNSKKTRTEVTITPVASNSACPKPSVDSAMDEDDENESADRLVIDEGGNSGNSSPSIVPADQVPGCQGCHSKAAQFVCAGCGNQWYCSRECQTPAGSYVGANSPLDDKSDSVSPGKRPGVNCSIGDYTGNGDNLTIDSGMG